MSLSVNHRSSLGMIQVSSSGGQLTFSYCFLDNTEIEEPESIWKLRGVLCIEDDQRLHYSLIGWSNSEHVNGVHFRLRIPALYVGLNAFNDQQFVSAFWAQYISKIHVFMSENNCFSISLLPHNSKKFSVLGDVPDTFPSTSSSMAMRLKCNYPTKTNLRTVQRFKFVRHRRSRRLTGPTQKINEVEGPYRERRALTVLHDEAVGDGNLKGHPLPRTQNVRHFWHYYCAGKELRQLYWRENQNNNKSQTSQCC